jgi:hypothetical protein
VSSVAHHPWIDLSNNREMYCIKIFEFEEEGVNESNSLSMCIFELLVAEFCF